MHRHLVLRSLVCLCAGLAIILGVVLPASAVPARRDMKAPLRQAVPATATQWNLARDFRIAPHQANPNPDRMGNARVWYFMKGTDLAHPSAFSLLPYFTKHAASIRRLETWQDMPCFLCLPLVGINETGQVQHPLTITWPAGMPAVHPLYGGVHVIVGWRSPISGTVRVKVTFSDLDANGGDGITWAIDKDAVRLKMHRLLNGGAPQTRRLTVDVSEGTFLYFVVETGPRDDYGFDTTGLDVVIRPLA